MNLFQALLNSLGWALMHSLWQMLVVTICLWLLLKIRRFQDIRLKYVSGMVSLALIFIAFVYTCFLYFKTSIPSVNALGSPYFAASNFTFSNQGADALILHPQTWFSRLNSILPYVVNAWLIGVFLFFIRLLKGISEIRNLNSLPHLPLRNPTQQKANELLELMGIKRRVQIMVSKAVQVPLTFGTFRPLVLLPFAMVLQMPPRHLEAIIAHELAHIRRFDFTLNLFQSAMEILFFYHPAFWWINGLVKETREHIADDLAISAGISPADLAHGLAGVVNQINIEHSSLSMAARGGHFPVLNRIKRMLGANVQMSYSPSPLISKTMIITSLLSLSLVLGAAYNSNHPAPEVVWLETSLIKANFGVAPPITLPNRPDEPKKSNVNHPKDTVRTEESQNGEDQNFKALVQKALHMGIPDLDSLPILWDSLPSMPIFNMGTAPVFDFDGHFKDSLQAHHLMKDFGDSIRFYTEKIVKLHSDSSIVSEEETKKLETEIARIQQKMTLHQEALEARMEQWSSMIKPQLEAFEKKMEEWMEENEPMIRKFEEEMEIWIEEQTSRNAEFEEKHRKHKEEWQTPKKQP